jgi:hypothetical protein
MSRPAMLATHVAPTCDFDLDLAEFYLVDSVFGLNFQTRGFYFAFHVYLLNEMREELF